MQSSDIQELSVDLDSRLMELFAMVWSEISYSDDAPQSNMILSGIARIAYEKGYRDALIEDTSGERAKLYTDNNFALPKGIE